MWFLQTLLQVFKLSIVWSSANKGYLWYLISPCDHVVKTAVVRISCSSGGVGTGLCQLENFLQTNWLLVYL